MLLDLPFDGATGLERPEYYYTWSSVNDINNTNAELCLKLVESVFAECPSIVKQLIQSCDENGRSVYNITHPNVKALFNEILFFCGRYELQEGPPLHVSATSIVIHATDHNIAQYYEKVFDEKMMDCYDDREGLTFKEFCEVFERIADCGLFQVSSGGRGGIGSLPTDDCFTDDCFEIPSIHGFNNISSSSNFTSNASISTNGPVLTSIYSCEMLQSLFHTSLITTSQS